MNQFNNAIQELQFAEQRLNDLVQEICNSLNKAVSEQKLEGVTDMTRESGPYFATVRFPTLAKENFSFSAETYIPAAQADAVSSALSSCKTTKQLCDKVKDMLDTGKVKKGSEVVCLNSETLRILRDSEIGQYVQKNA